LINCIKQPVKLWRIVHNAFVFTLVVQYTILG